MIIKTLKYSLKMILKDFTSVISVIIVPILLFSLGLVLDKQINKSKKIQISYRVCDNDSSELSKDLIKYLETQNYKVIPMNEEDLITNIKNENTAFGIVIPKGFEESLKNSESAKLKFINVNMSSIKEVAKNVTNLRVARYDSLLKTFNDKDISKVIKSIEVADGKGIKLSDEFIESNNKYSDMGFGVGFGLFIMSSWIISSSRLLLDSKFNKTYNRVKSSPVNPLSYIGGMALANLVIASFQIVAFYIISKFVFKANYAEVATWYLFLFTVSVILIVNAVYLFAKDYSVNGILSTIMIPMAMISGCFWNIEFNPDFINKVAALAPFYWVNKGVQGLSKGLTRIDFLRTTGVLFAFIILFLMISIYAFKRSEE